MNLSMKENSDSANKETGSMILFSLVVATYGRSTELGRLLESLTWQEILLNQFEVIIVDQNDTIDLSKIIDEYRALLSIVHIKSSKKGLSFNRNIGIRQSRGKYLCFPDDDCTYYPDTLAKALTNFSSPGVSTVFGAIRDRVRGKNIIRNWPQKKVELTRRNFFFLNSSITIFTKNNKVLFDESLGVGCYFGSCEDADFSYRQIKQGKAVYYPDIEVWHPEIGLVEFSKEKNISYGLGFGAFCCIHKKDLFIIWIFLAAIGFHLAKGVFAILKFDLEQAGKRKDAVWSRMKGFYQYGCLEKN